MSVTPPKELIKLGIYPDPNNIGVPVPVLSREKKIWAVERVKDNVGYDEVLAPSNKDHIQLASRTLSVIDELLKIVADGNMFTYEEAEQMVETNCTSGTRGCPIILGELSFSTRKRRLWILSLLWRRSTKARLKHTLRRTTRTWTFR